jgi:proteasome accessory factor B
MPPGFSLERYLRNAWQIYPEPGRKRKIVIRFNAEVAESVGEAVWHQSQQLQINADGTLDVCVWVSGFREISSWILSYCDHAEVLFPLQLREMIVQRLKRMTERYRPAPVHRKPTLRLPSQRRPPETFTL